MSYDSRNDVLAVDETPEPRLMERRTEIRNDTVGPAPSSYGETIESIEGTWVDSGMTYRVRQIGDLISIVGLNTLGNVQFQGKGNFNNSILQANIWFTDSTWGFASIMFIINEEKLAGSIVNGVTGAVMDIILHRETD